MKKQPNLEKFNKVLTSIIKNIELTEADLQLEAEQDYAQCFRYKIINKLNEINWTELLKEPFTEWLDEKTEHTLAKPVLENFVRETIELAYENFINDVPMTALCRTIEIDLRQMLGEEELPDPAEWKYTRFHAAFLD